MGTDKHTLNHTSDKGRTSSSLDVANLKKGTKFRYQGYLYHVVDKCDDNGTILIIVKYFGKYKKWWHYEILEADDFDERVELRLITKNK